MKKVTIQANLTLDSDRAETLRALAGPTVAMSGSLLPAIQDLLAKGIAAEMGEHFKPISPAYLAPVTAWPGILDLARQWRDAVCRDAGLMGPLGSKYRFVEVPAGTQFADPHRQVFIVLHDRWDLSAAGWPVLLPDKDADSPAEGEQ